MTKKSEHDCPCCTCGQMELSWSDRSWYVYPDDIVAIVNAIISCALDHYYDRYDGVPHGLTWIKKGLDDAVRPIIVKHLSAINSEWEDHSVDMNESQRKSFREELLAKVKEIMS